MPTNITENEFERIIENHLIQVHGYRKRSTLNYDKDFCVDKDLLIEYIQSTQGDKWEKLISIDGKQLGEKKFLDTLNNKISKYGLLEVLRKGIKDRGLQFDLAQFKPVSGLNPQLQDLYNKNIFSIIRQLKYSKFNEKSIDTVIFLNGLPIYTIELKNPLTGQTVKNAITQYRDDRDPKERLLNFKRCLVHFAVDPDLVYMTTKLNGNKTFFLPFNKGNDYGAGNPTNSNGYKTSYFYEDILSKETILEILGNYVVLETKHEEDEVGKKITKETLIFPRFHQLDVVRKIVDDVKEKGSGVSYLVQHSAGSGKSNSIAWLSHHLAELHNSEDDKIFDSVIVITDRKVLDKQLQDTISQFEIVPGVVKKIDENSAQLKKALMSGQKIIITTLQKFPVIVNNIDELPGSNFAVIIDEAHSSQSGESVKSLKKVLNVNTLQEAELVEDELEKDFEDNVEDIILKELKSRGKSPNISYFAFTATPKQKTLELFGTKNYDGTFSPFHLYSMKQAIEEKFILDVLKNYITYKTYFSIVKKIDNDPKFEKSKAFQLIKKYVDLHSHSINKKVEIIVNHFWENIKDQIGGKAKAMIVTKSRLHAVRFKLAFDKYLKENGYPIHSIVAFSGTVKDPDTLEDYTESNMNGFSDNNTKKEFKKNKYKFLIVAEKFQTGFDEPLLSAMYVDKKLGGVNAVQTLSRLNRSNPNKEETFILDFVNDTDTIKESFQPYYQTTVLSQATDLNKLYDLETDLLNYHIFTKIDVDNFAKHYFKSVSQNKLNSLLDPIVQVYNNQEKQAKDTFKKQLQKYTKDYSFISQIINFEDSDLEKLFVFAKFLYKKLPKEKYELPIEIINDINMDGYKIKKISQGSIELDKEGGILDPIVGDGLGKMIEDEQDLLSSIIKNINEIYGAEITDEDREILNNQFRNLSKRQDLRVAIQNNSKDNAKIMFDKIFNDELTDLVNNHFEFYQKVVNDKNLENFIKARMFDYMYKESNQSIH
ncbi:MAG: type I restriction endonuclease [Candidatus Absconditabacteria bacterium]